MVKMSHDLKMWLWRNHKLKMIPIMMGFEKLFTKRMFFEYLDWRKEREEV